MTITVKQYEEIKRSLPIQSGNLRLQNLDVLKGILKAAERGCKERGLSPRFGTRHGVLCAHESLGHKGVVDRVFEDLQTEQIVRIDIEAFSLDSTSVKVHADGACARKNRAASHGARPAVVGTLKFTWLPQMLERLWSSSCRRATLTMRRRGGCVCKNLALRNRTAFPQAEGIPPHLLRIREARCGLHRLYQFRSYRRNAQIRVKWP